MLAPTIHLNGSPRERLLEAVCDARGAVLDAITALGAVCPNGRDYYPQGVDANRQAIREYRDMVARLESVASELSDLAEAIAG